MNNRLILQELDETLYFWETICLLSLLQQKEVKQTDFHFSNAIGLFGTFSQMKGLKNYDALRIALGNNVQFGEDSYLPSPEKGRENPSDKISFARSGTLSMEAITFYPYMLSHWIKTKKVFKLKSSDIIPLKNPSEKNYLKFLPCSAFIINFEEAVEIGFETTPIIKRYKSCIVVSSGDLVDTFWIPEDLASKSLHYKKYKFLQSLLKSKHPLSQKQIYELYSIELKFNPMKNPPFFQKISFHKEHPLFFFAPVQKQGENEYRSSYNHIFGKNVQIYEMKGSEITNIHTIPPTKGRESILEDSVQAFRFFFELINGFAYAVSGIKPKNLELSDSGKKSNHTELSRNFNWNEIPITKTDYLEGNDLTNGPLQVSYGSGEKSPHIRRGHFRHIIKKDGTYDAIWIEEVMVRADKLKDEELKGSVTVIKKERLL